VSRADTRRMGGGRGDTVKRWPAVRRTRDNRERGSPGATEALLGAEGYPSDVGRRRDGRPKAGPWHTGGQGSPEQGPGGPEARGALGEGGTPTPPLQ
jgi:hypothetical protein